MSLAFSFSLVIEQETAMPPWPSNDVRTGKATLQGAQMRVDLLPPNGGNPPAESRHSVEGRPSEPHLDWIRAAPGTLGPRQHAVAGAAPPGPPASADRARAARRCGGRHTGRGNRDKG